MNVARIRQSRTDYGLGIQVQIPKCSRVFVSLGSGYSHLKLELGVDWRPLDPLARLPRLEIALVLCRSVWNAGFRSCRFEIDPVGVSVWGSGFGL